jgi:hypothetical protein
MIRLAVGQKVFPAEAQLSIGIAEMYGSGR